MKILQNLLLACVRDENREKSCISEIEFDKWTVLWDYIVDIYSPSPLHSQADLLFHRDTYKVLQPQILKVSEERKVLIPRDISRQHLI